VTSILPLRNIPLTIDLHDCQLHTRYPRIRTCSPSRTSVGSGRGRGTRFQARLVSRSVWRQRVSSNSTVTSKALPPGSSQHRQQAPGPSLSTRETLGRALSRPAIAQRAIRSTLFCILKPIQPGHRSSHSNSCLKPPTLQTCYSSTTLLRCPQDVAAFFTAVPSTRHHPPLHYCTKLPAIGASAVVPT
jgi:hypothetical protein